MLHQPEEQMTVAVMTNVYTPLDEFETNLAISNAVLGVVRGR